jgi:hypothetical protein
MALTTIDATDPAGGSRWANRQTGDALTIAAGVLFLLLCMMLPLVGPAAAHGSGSPGATTAAHFGKNQAAFSVMLGLTFSVAVLATVCKLAARARIGGRLPYIALGIDAACAVILVVYAAGLLKI